MSDEQNEMLLSDLADIRMHLKAENRRLRDALVAAEMMLEDHYCVVRYDRPTGRSIAVEAALDAIRAALNTGAMSGE